MQKKRFNEGQIVAAIKKQEAGIPAIMLTELVT